MSASTLESYRQRANQAIAAELARFRQDCPAERLQCASSYGLNNGGKRIRAALVYATGEALGAAEEHLDAAATAIEMIHAYSLVHDDLPAMDNDELRRGHPTCHIAFDEATAILAGDALQSMAYEVLTRPRHTAVSSEQVLLAIQCLAARAGITGMVGGQMLDTDPENPPATQADLERIHRHKTGDLLCAAVLLGFYFSPYYQENRIRGALQTFGHSIGLAFQIQDDILDMTSDTDTLGKQANHDAATNKQTYPALIGLEASGNLLQEYCNRSLEALNTIPWSMTELANIADYIIQRSY